MDESTGIHRRRLLMTGLSGAPWLAGCLALPDGGSATPRPTATIVDRGPLPDIPVEPSIEVTRATASEAGPPELLARVENSVSHPIEVGEERAIVFAYVSSGDGDGVTLVPVEDGPDPVESGCWRLADAIAVPEYYGIVTLEPGESTQRRLRVWGSPDSSGCLPRGEFRFTTHYAGAQDRTEAIEDQEWSGSWGFTLALE